MLVSNPLWEKRQMSALAVPLAGRCSRMGLPPSAQELFVVENAPSAATLRSRSLPGEEMPAVVGSTTTMSLPVAVGDELVSEMISSDGFGAATINETVCDSVPSGFCSWMETIPASATSAAVTGAVHSCVEMHNVVFAVPAMNSVEPGPGLEAAKPLPSTRSVNPCAAPMYTLEGCNVRMFGPPAIVTLAEPDWVVSSELMATTWMAFGEGGEAGAVKIPFALTVPQTPAVAHAAP